MNNTNKGLEAFMPFTILDIWYVSCAITIFPILYSWTVSEQFKLTFSFIFFFISFSGHTVKYSMTFGYFWKKAQYHVLKLLFLKKCLLCCPWEEMKGAWSTATFSTFTFLFIYFHSLCSFTPECRALHSSLSTRVVYWKQHITHKSSSCRSLSVSVPELFCHCASLCSGALQQCLNAICSHV